VNPIKYIEKVFFSHYMFYLLYSSSGVKKFFSTTALEIDGTWNFLVFLV